MNEHWRAGASSTEAAIVGASERLRPILMTACAMTVGMVPMALALERGSQMQAPLGLAVIGGLVMSTFATLLVLPSIFVVVIGQKAARSPSIYPGDPTSRFYDPLLFGTAGKPAVHGLERNGTSKSTTNGHPQSSAPAGLVPASGSTSALHEPDSHGTSSETVLAQSEQSIVDPSALVFAGASASSAHHPDSRGGKPETTVSDEHEP